jgi:hypothetical protein
MSTVPARLAALLAMLAISFGAGFFVKGQLTQAGQAKQATAALQKSAQNVVVAAAESNRIETEVAKVEANVASIKSAVAKRGVTLHPRKEPQVEPAFRNDSIDVRAGSAPALVASGTQDACGPGTGFYLDDGTVRLLNAARQGRGVDAAGGSDEAQSAPSSVGVADLIANDLDIVQMYHDLAKRHDELVDAVEKHLKDQAR